MNAATDAVPAVRETLRAALHGARNPDGGWGYYAGKASRLEPTCWTLLALGSDVANDESAALLARWPRQDGFLLEHRGGRVNFAFHGLAIVTALARAVTPAEPMLRAMVDPLVGAKGIRAKPNDYLRQDNSLQGWSWTEGTFSWVEPTAWCLLAIKQARSRHASGRASARIEEAERLLLDRACPSGGWNYGNPVTLGQELPSYVPVTAIVLLALQDRVDHPVVARGVHQLRGQPTREVSGMALALSSICLDVHGAAPDDLRADLLRHVTTTVRMGNIVGLAMALCALDGGAHAAFRL